MRELKKLEEMTVEELRKESRLKGLKLQEGGKKYTKQQLIERLDECRKECEALKEAKRKKNKPIVFATNFVEIVEKYGNRKPMVVYRTMRKDDIIVFIHHVDAMDGNVYRKIRTAKIKKIGWEDETIELEMLSGDRVTITFDDVLYIRKKGNALPPDIRKYIAYKRTKTGVEMVERLVHK